MRFQALMPDILHWLGITKIDRMLSMSNMKHDAIVDQGIEIKERVPIPDESEFPKTSDPGSPARLAKPQMRYHAARRLNTASN